MKTIYLHIGTHKTGTTSIQRFLAANREQLLSHGYCYPKAAIPTFGKGHHMLTWALTHGDYRYDKYTGVSLDLRNVWRECLAEIQSTDTKNIILSCENLCRLKPEEISKVKENFSDHEVKVILFLRKQESFLCSLYSERVKKGYSSNIEAFLQEYRDRFDYRSIIHSWESVFGYQNMLVNTYEEGCNAIEKILDLVSIERSTPPSLNNQSEIHNPSLSNKSLKLIRFLNLIFLENLSLPYSWCRKFYLLPLQRYKIKKACTFIPDLFLDDHILSKDLADFLMREYELMNQEIADRYFPKSPGSLL